METNDPFSPAPASAKKTNIWLIVGGVAAALLCCCCLLILAGFVILGPAISNVYETIPQELAPSGFEEIIPQDDAQPQPFELPATTETPEPFDGTVPSMDEYIPSGGLGDEVQRTNAWALVLFNAAMNSCTFEKPSAITIEVLSKPDSDGIWTERWVASCNEGGQKSYDVTFKPLTDGTTDVVVEPAP